MNELSLFTGAGGGLLGTKLLGWKAIGYVEKEPYCQKVIQQRIADGILDAAPIFGDIRKFISEGYAASYTGLVDVVTAGFPCQPFSVAGKRKQADDERNMWPATADVIGIVKPRFVLLENVPGVRSGKTTDENEETWAKMQKDGKVSTPPLTLAVKMWPTPSSNNGTGGATGLAGGSGNRLKLYEMLGKEEGKKMGCQSLNPNWVEWLMGWPIGWTDLKPLAMDKYRQWLLAHGER